MVKIFCGKVNLMPKKLAFNSLKMLLTTLHNIMEKM